MKRRTQLFILLSLGLSLGGRSDSFVIDASVLAASSFESEQVLDQLKGIVFLNNWDQVRKEPRVDLCGVVVDQVAFLACYPHFLEKIRQSYIGQPLTQEAIFRLKTEVANLYSTAGQPFVVVSIPRQDLTKGVLQVVVSSATFGSVSVKGNRFVSPERLKSLIRAKSGQPIKLKELVQDLARMNQNPFRRTDAIFRPGQKAGIADLELATIDRWPYRFYMGADNTGQLSTERDRLFFGLNLGKTIVEDSEISYQFTCSPNWHRFVSQTALFRVPFPARQTLIIYGGFAQAKPDLADGNHEKSTSWQIDGRYRIPLITNSSFLQELLLGFDFKQVTARIKNHGTSIFDHRADIDQFMIGYDLGHKGFCHKLSLVAELYASPGGMSFANKTSAFLNFRSDSGPQYVYFKLSHSFMYKFRPLWFSYDLNGQIASKNLLPSEQFSLSGYYAVRGFEERIVSVDDAFLLNLTIQTPRVSIGKMAGWSKRSFDELYFLLFFDYGLGGNHQSYKNESRTMSLASIGPGIRYQIDRYLTARFDYGFQLFHHGFHNPSNSRYNFGLIVSF